MIDKALQKYNSIIDFFSSEEEKNIRKSNTWGFAFALCGLFVAIAGLLMTSHPVLGILTIVTGLTMMFGASFYFEKIMEKQRKKEKIAVQALNVSVFEELKTGKIKEIFPLIENDEGRVILKELVTNILENENQQYTIGLLQQIKNTTLEKDKNKAVDDFLRKNNFYLDINTRHQQLMDML